MTDPDTTILTDLNESRLKKTIDLVSKKSTASSPAKRIKIKIQIIYWFTEK